MTDKKAPAREFWINNHRLHGSTVFDSDLESYKAVDGFGTERIHVIEYDALTALQSEVDRLRSEIKRHHLMWGDGDTCFTECKKLCAALSKGSEG